MKPLVLMAMLLVPWCCISARAQTGVCPGNTTAEMRNCAEQAVKTSTTELRRKLPSHVLGLWQRTTRSVCQHAYQSYKDGSIYPQLVVGCENNLNRALLEEFRSLAGESER
ncbi:MAG: DUF1311 domain-containing protein [Prochlorococcaceae cyanobacterium]